MFSNLRLTMLKKILKKILKIHDHIDINAEFYIYYDTDFLIYILVILSSNFE